LPAVCRQLSHHRGSHEASPKSLTRNRMRRSARRSRNDSTRVGCLRSSTGIGSAARWRPFAVCDPRRRVSKTIRPRGRVFFKRAAHLVEARQLLGDERDRAERSLSVVVAARQVFIAPHCAPACNGGDPCVFDPHSCRTAGLTRAANSVARRLNLADLQPVPAPE
jgi:hypothetical protein